MLEEGVIAIKSTTRKLLKCPSIGVNKGVN